MLAANKIELHYFFINDSHTIDALIRHKCEGEILKIAKELITTFGYNIDIASEAAAEGGFKEFWKLLGTNNTQLTFIATVIALILSRIPTSNSELEQLQIENLKLGNEEKRLNIEKIKKDLDKNEDSTAIKNAVGYLDANYKIIKYKSNFYQNLSTYEKVNKISTLTYFDNEPANNPNYVNRADFKKFILASNKLPPETTENVTIEIISPVLKDGKYKWKGIYKGEIIDFSMLDINYKKSVVNKEVAFHNGYSIQCVLRTSRKIDDLGIIHNTGYAIIAVTGTIEDGKLAEIKQVTKYKRPKNEEHSQIDLFNIE